jgi:uncharacterized membrane protein
VVEEIVPDAVIITLVCPQSVKTVSPSLAVFLLLTLTVPDAVIILPPIVIGGCEG